MSASTTKIPRSQITSTAWAVALLTAAKAPVTQNNVNNILRWMQLEGGSSGGTPGISGSMETWLHLNDPLNATLHESGPFSYPTVEAGISATAQMLHQQNMAPILNALNRNASTASFSAALAASPWDGSHYASQIARYGSNFLAAFPMLAAYATTTGQNPTSTIGGAFGIGSQPSTSINAIIAGAAAKMNALQIGTALAKGATVLENTPQGGLSGAVSGTSHALSTIGQDVSHLVSAATDVTFWRRVGIFLGGGAIAVVGLILLLSQTKAGKEAASTAAVAAAA